MESVAAISTAQPPATSPLTATLSAEQIEQIKQARLSAKKIHRAVKYARFDAWCVAIFAAASLAFGLLDLVGFALGAGMAAVAFVEFRASSAMKQGDPRSARTLGLNQLFFAGLLIAYAAYSIYATATGPSPIASTAAQSKEIADMVRPFEDLISLLLYAVYGSLIFIACTVQVGTAIYFFTRRKHVEKYVNETPAWILQMQREGVQI